MWCEPEVSHDSQDKGLGDTPVVESPLASQCTYVFMQEKEVKLKAKMSHFKSGWGENFVNGFMSLFGRDGRIVRKGRRAFLAS